MASQSTRWANWQTSPPLFCLRSLFNWRSSVRFCRRESSRSAGWHDLECIGRPSTAKTKISDVSPCLSSSFVGGAGEVDITPDGPTWLAGYADRRHPSFSVGLKLRASALVLRDERGRSICIVSFDLLFIGPELAERLREFASEKLGIARQDLLIAASHTHFAPQVDGTKPALGTFNAEYLAYIATQCCDLLANLVLSTLRPLHFRTSVVRWDGAVYRRRWWHIPHISCRRMMLGGVVMAPDRRKEISRDVRLLEMLDPTGAPIAFLWSAACHPTSWPHPDQLSSDYVGAVREQLAQLVGEHTPVLFLQGFGGDIRPDVPEHRPLLRRLRDTALFGPSFDAFTPAEWRLWVGRLAAVVAMELEKMRRAPAVPATGGFATALVSVPLSEVVNGQDSDERSIAFQRIRLGTMADIVAVSAEPCSSLLALLDEPAIWPIGYCDDVFGYWPTDRQLAEGGYEVAYHLESFNLKGSLRHGLDRVFRETVTKLRDQIERNSATIC